MTESDVLSQATLHSVSQLISEIERLITGVEEKGVTLPKTVEVYLEVSGIPHAFEAAEVEWRYYMVDITAQRIFWLHEFDATEMSFEIGGVAADSKAVFGECFKPLPRTDLSCAKTELEHKLASEYWMHMENFPHRTIPANVLKTLTGILMQWSIGTLSSLTRRISKVNVVMDRPNDFIRFYGPVQLRRPSEAVHDGRQAERSVSSSSFEKKLLPDNYNTRATNGRRSQ